MTIAIVCRNSHINERVNANWYRNGTSRTYHAPSADWVRTGLAVCGADIGRAGYATTNPRGTAGKHPCRKCIKKLAENA